MAQTAVQAACAEMKSASISVRKLKIIQEHSEHFFELCKTLKYKEMDGLARKRFAQLQAFGDEREQLVAFIRYCHMLEAGTVSIRRHRLE